MSIVGAETSFSEQAGFPCTVEHYQDKETLEYVKCPNCDRCSYNSKGRKCWDNPKI